MSRKRDRGEAGARIAGEGGLTRASEVRNDYADGRRSVMEGRKNANGGLGWMS